MTTLTATPATLKANPAPERITAAELREQFATLTEEVARLRKLIEQKLMATSSPLPAPIAIGPCPKDCRDFLAEQAIVGVDDNGQPTYKLKGFPFVRFGVRIWPEALPRLGLDPETLKPGPNQLPNGGMVVRAVLDGKGHAKKIVGLGNPDSVRHVREAATESGDKEQPF